MKFENLVTLLEDTDEDILSGMDTYEQKFKPYYNISVQLLKTPEHPNGIIEYWVFEIENEDQLKINTLFHKGRKNYSSSDGNNYYSFKRQYWDMVTQDKNLLQSAIKKFINHAKKINMPVTKKQVLYGKNIDLQLENTEEDILAGMDVYERDNSDVYEARIVCRHTAASYDEISDIFVYKQKFKDVMNMLLNYPDPLDVVADELKKQITSKQQAFEQLKYKGGFTHIKETPENQTKRVVLILTGSYKELKDKIDKFIKEYNVAYEGVLARYRAEMYDLKHNIEEQTIKEDSEEDILAGMEKYENENRPIYNVDVFNHGDGVIAVVLRPPVPYKKTYNRFREMYMDTQGWYSSNGIPTYTKFNFKNDWRYFTTSKEKLNNVIDNLKNDARERGLLLHFYDESK